MNKIIAGILAVIVAISVAIVVVGNLSKQQTTAPIIVDSGDSNNPTVDHFLSLDGWVKVGTTTPTALSNIVAGTCTATFSSASLAATSSGQFFCTATGVRASDKVLVQLPAGASANAQGAGSIYGGFVTSGAYATTSNRIGFNITNLTGAATTSFAQATTGIQFFVFR